MCSYLFVEYLVMYKVHKINGLVIHVDILIQNETSTDHIINHSKLPCINICDNDIDMMGNVKTF